MLEYIVIFVIVGWAVWYTARKLWGETQESGCENCYCSEKKSPLLSQIRISDTDHSKPKKPFSA
jgi:hypothetical protein